MEIFQIPIYHIEKKKVAFCDRRWRWWLSPGRRPLGAGEDQEEGKAQDDSDHVDDDFKTDEKLEASCLLLGPLVAVFIAPWGPSKIPHYWKFTNRIVPSFEQCPNLNKEINILVEFDRRPLIGEEVEGDKPV